MIIWAGNLPEEIPFYILRLQGGWQYLALALVLFHFVAALRGAPVARPEAQRIPPGGAGGASCSWCAPWTCTG